MSLTFEIKNLLEILSDSRSSILGCDVIPWSSPIPVFGRLAESSLATLGINPSNREFVAQDGSELDGAQRRFQTLKSLGLNTWSDASLDDINRIEKPCIQYFEVNPYDRWFKPLDRIILSSGNSYYSRLFPACHLDLVPFATWYKWGSLPASKKNLLWESSKLTFGRLIRDSPVKIIILNGQSVIRQFQMLVPDRLDKVEMPAWDLMRRRGENIQGYAYRTKVKLIGDIDLRKEVVVLGYNHNIQSSFGVTKEVMSNISHWLSREIEKP